MPANSVHEIRRQARYPIAAVAVAVGVALVLAMSGFVIAQPNANAAPAPAPALVNLRTAAAFSVLGGQTVTNTGPTVVGDDLGVSPGTSVTGFPPGTVNGTVHAADTVAGQAQTDLTTAYNDAAGLTPTGTVTGDIGGQTFMPGVYNASSSLGLTGTVTLDGAGDRNAVFVFQIGSTLTTASASDVRLINGARACNVFWQVGSSATLGTEPSVSTRSAARRADPTFSGTILALTSITVTTGVSISGRALARNGAVTLDTDSITAPNCPPVRRHKPGPGPCMHHHRHHRHHHAPPALTG